MYIEWCLLHCLKQSHDIFLDENKQAENPLTEKLQKWTILYTGLFFSLNKKVKICMLL